MNNNFFNNKLGNIKPSSTLTINEISNKMIQNGKEIYKFGLGQSPFPIPEKLLIELKKNAHRKSYLDVSGLYELRNAVSKYHKHRNKYNYAPELTLIGPGSKQLLFLCQMATNCILILPSPSWVSYEPQANFLNKKVRYIPTSKKDKWHLSPQNLENFCKSNPKQNKMLILNSPNNPTGTNNNYLRNISKVCKKYNILVISDEIYSELDYSGNYLSITHYYPEGTIISSGLSKWCGAGGWRLGTLIFPNELFPLFKIIKSLASETFTSVSAPIQFAAVKAYTENHKEYLMNSRKILRFIGFYVYKNLIEMGVDCLKPEGGFYILCDFSKIIKKNKNIKNSTDFCNKVLEETGLAMLPGSCFGIKDAKMFTRIAFVDFDGKKCLNYIKKKKNLNKKDLKILFPKILMGLQKLNEWIIEHKNNKINFTKM